MRQNEAMQPPGPSGGEVPTGPAVSGHPAASDDPAAPESRLVPNEQEQGPDQFTDAEPSDWVWVEEWRRGAEPVPWGPGLALAGFITFLVASAIYVLSDGLSDRPIVAIGVNVVVAGGLGPALWLSRGLPVLRWIAAGAVVGLLAAWLSVLIFLT